MQENKYHMAQISWVQMKLICKNEQWYFLEMSKYQGGIFAFIYDFFQAEIFQNEKNCKTFEYFDV